MKLHDVFRFDDLNKSINEFLKADKRKIICGPCDIRIFTFVGNEVCNPTTVKDLSLNIEIESSTPRLKLNKDGTLTEVEKEEYVVRGIKGEAELTINVCELDMLTKCDEIQIHYGPIPGMRGIIHHLENIKLKNMRFNSKTGPLEMILKFSFSLMLETNFSYSKDSSEKKIK